jgi:chemotaxis protein methyltransferase CheR
MSEPRFAELCTRIEERCGLHFGDSRRASLQAAVRARMEQLGIPSPETYCSRLIEQTGDEELRSLINLVTITETCFFRDPAQFRMLRRHILPSVMRDRRPAGDRRVRIWSAGCSSGEEAYSIALTLAAMGCPPADGWMFEVVGTDVNTERLEAARRGVYSPRAVRNVEADCLQQYFRAEGGRYRLDPSIANAVRFEYGNLVDDSTFAADRFDVILCKNVSIYFRPEATRSLVRRLFASLSEGGYLLLGHSESLWQMEEGFTLVEHDGVFCYQKPSAGTVPAAGGAAPVRLRPAEGDRGHDSTDGGPAYRPDGEYERCLGLFRAGDWLRAEADVRALMRSSPDFVPAQLLMAGIHAHLGRYGEAATLAEQVLRVNELEPKAHLLLGMVSARAGRTDAAVDALRRALYLDDSLALAYFWLGNLYRERGDLTRARGEHVEAVARYERRVLDFTEEFAADLSPVQIVDFCRQSARRLESAL